MLQVVSLRSEFEIERRELSRGHRRALEAAEAKEKRHRQRAAPDDGGGGNVLGALLHAIAGSPTAESASQRGAARPSPSKAARRASPTRQSPSGGRRRARQPTRQSSTDGRWREPTEAPLLHTSALLTADELTATPGTPSLQSGRSNGEHQHSDQLPWNWTN
jgi:hypothetical protein